MANSEGGVILVGVDEDPARPRYPLLQPVGVPTDGAAERVASKGYQAIHEPVYPEVATIAFPNDPSRCVVAIRIQPSERAPHAVGGGTDVYVRVDSQSMPAASELESRIGLDRLEAQFQRRLRGRAILDAAEERWKQLLDRTTDGQPGTVRVEVTVGPALAPTRPFTLVELRQLAARPSRNAGGQFPDAQLRAVSSGLVSCYEPRDCFLDVTGLTAATSGFNAGPMANVSPAPERILYPQWMGETVVQLHWTAWAAINAGRGGTLVMRMRLDGIAGTALLFGGGFAGFDADGHRALQPAAESEVRMPAEDVFADPIGASVALLAGVSEAFDWEEAPANLRARFTEERLSPR